MRRASASYVPCRGIRGRMLLLFHKNNAADGRIRGWKRALTALILVCLIASACLLVFAPGGAIPGSSASGGEEEEEAPKKYIHWVDFNVPLEVMEQALQYDLKSHAQDGGVKLDWIELLAYTAAKSGGVFKEGQKSAAMDALVTRLKKGEKIDDITAQMRYYAYYKEAYNAVLGGFVGVHDVADENGKVTRAYGLKVYSPIAKSYGFGHYDDFGNTRTYGYKRLHLGNDLCGSVGVPIIAVEGGVVENLGWNQYGGWRVGIRSFDKLRYYYYAHLRKGHPYAAGLEKGDTVKAGDVIGYMGMTGYSTKEDTNNVKIPHLHFGLQLIFDESQVDGTNQIWVDVYHIVDLLGRQRMPVTKLPNGEYVRADGIAQETEGK